MKPLLIRGLHGGSFWRLEPGYPGKVEYKQISIVLSGKEKLREQIAKARQKAEEERLRKHEEMATLALNKWSTLF